MNERNPQETLAELKKLNETLAQQNEHLMDQNEYLLARHEELVSQLQQAKRDRVFHFILTGASFFIAVLSIAVSLF